MNKQGFLKFTISTVCAILTLAISNSIVIALGLWHENDYIRLVLMGGVGFSAHFFLFSYLIKKINDGIQNLISRSVIIRIYWAIALIFLVLAGVTCVLLLRDGSYSTTRILGITTVYISVASYFLGSLLGIYKSKT
ncbi:MAG: hypothetical protein WBC07_12865 [Methylotenera sp.]